MSYKPARHVDPHPVREMAAVRELEPHHRVAGVQQRVVHGDVRLRARVRLHVRVLGAEQVERALDREALGDVDVLAAAVVALARIALGVLVGEDRSLALEHRHRDEVLGRDHLERALLALELQREHLRDLRIDLGKGPVEEVGREIGGAHWSYEPSNGTVTVVIVAETNSGVRFAAPPRPPDRPAPTPRAARVRRRRATASGRPVGSGCRTRASAGSSPESRVLRHDDVAHHEQPVRRERVPDPAEQIGLRQRRTGGARTARSRPGRTDPPGADPRSGPTRSATASPGSASPATASIRSFSSMPDQHRVRVAREQPARRLAGSGPELEDPPRARPAGAGELHPGARRRPGCRRGSRRRTSSRRSGTASAAPRSARARRRRPPAPPFHSPSAS